MPEIAINGTVLHYEEAGAGEPLLLLHGGGGTALLHFRGEIAELAEHYHVIAPDFRGYGRSLPPRLFPLDFYQQDGADLAALVRALGLTQISVAGWSDGSIAGLILAADYPDLVRSLCVWGSEGRILPEERACWTKITNWQEWPPHTLARFIEAQGPLNWPCILERMLVGYTAVLDAGGVIVSDRLHQVRCPTLIIHGDRDDVVPPVHAPELHRLIVGSELRVLPGAGHALHRERHDELMTLLKDFLARQTSDRRAPERAPMWQPRG